MTGYQSKRAAAQDKLAHLTLEQRCRLSEQCLPEAPYREMLTKLHDEMLKALAQPEQEPVAWAVQACSKMWRGEFAEIDAKAEAKRIGGTCVAYPLYTAQREWAGLTDEDWEKVSNRKNTVLDTFEQGAVWAAYKLERRNT